MALLMFCGDGHHAGRPIETQHPGLGQGGGEAKNARKRSVNAWSERSKSASA
jgi:hypothetical protein